MSICGVCAQMCTARNKSHLKGLTARMHMDWNCNWKALRIQKPLEAASLSILVPLLPSPLPHSMSGTMLQPGDVGVLFGLLPPPPSSAAQSFCSPWSPWPPWSIMPSLAQSHRIIFHLQLLPLTSKSFLRFPREEI